MPYCEKRYERFAVKKSFGNGSDDVINCFVIEIGNNKIEVR